MAGAPCPIEVMKHVIDKMNMKDVTIAYGMTETSPVSFQTGFEDPLERRVSTIGRVQPHIECKIVDLDGEVVPRGQSGEFCTRGYSVMLGYWDDPQKTAEVIDADGWMHTGDLATIDDAGYGNIVGRIKDMVIRGGENIYPREIEEYLYRHPKVQDVRLLASPTSATARSSAPGSASSPARPRPPTKSATSAAARSPTTRSRATSRSSMRSR